jgi:hypothetical protein
VLDLRLPISRSERVRFALHVLLFLPYSATLKV